MISIREDTGWIADLRAVPHHISWLSCKNYTPVQLRPALPSSCSLSLLSSAGWSSHMLISSNMILQHLHCSITVANWFDLSDLQIPDLTKVHYLERLSIRAALCLALLGTALLG